MRHLVSIPAPLSASTQLSLWIPSVALTSSDICSYVLVFNPGDLYYTKIYNNNNNKRIFRYLDSAIRS